MPNSQRILLLAPTAIESVDIAAADAAALDLDVDVVVAKRLRLELVLVEFEPGGRSVDLEPGELVGIRHCEVAIGLFEKQRGIKSNWAEKQERRASTQEMGNRAF